MTNSPIADLASRIARLEEQRKDINDDIKDIYTVAKSQGINPTALRKAVKIAAMEADKRAKHESEQSDLILYLAEIEGREQREAAE